MILVYSNTITPRVRFSFDLIFTRILGQQVDFTKNKDELSSFEGIRINYSNQEIEGSLQFKINGLLHKKGIENPDINVFSWRDTPVFFKVNNDNFPFDAFAASFYLATRYEEYLPHARDKFNRFNAEDSVAYKHNFLHIPVINIWAQWIEDLIATKFPAFQKINRKYRFVSTIDVDNAYAYIEKGFVRTLGGLALTLLNKQKEEFHSRIETLRGIKTDPFDTFKKLKKLHDAYHVEAKYFFLLGDYGLNDKNVPYTSKKFQSLMKEVADYYEVGIHPSFASNDDVAILKKEIDRLFSIIHKKIEISRQHFLKLEFPSTYRNLIECEVKEDYTMGYASQLGFRASVCSSYLFYDLDREHITDLIIHPFCFMEATLRHYLDIEATDAVNTLKPVIDAVKAVNGTCIGLWHNESISGIYPWQGWENVYEDVLKIAV